MSILGGPLLEDAEVDEIVARYPTYRGTLPTDVRHWTEAELETFLASGGQRRPNELGREGQASLSLGMGLLTKTRVKLAELKATGPPAEYISYCRHRQQRSNFCNLPAVASCSPVQRVREVPEKLIAPVTVMPKRIRGSADPPLRSWNMKFWAEEYGLEYCTCKLRWPAFEHDSEGVDSLTLEAGLAEYLEYMFAVECKDEFCLEEQGLAYPRIQVGDFCPFTGSARRLFKEHWRSWSPPGVHDLTARWCEIHGSIFEQDPESQLAQFYRLHFGVVGAVSRLHKENHNAHLWLTQLEGQRLFFLFPPEDEAAGRLYELQGGFDEDRADGNFGYATHISPVDVFFPSQKRHPLFADCNAQVSLLGEGKSLVIPAGWWWCSVATQPSVTLHHTYWGFENRLGIVDALWAPFESKQTSVDARNSMRPAFTELRETIAEDDGCKELEDYVVVEGGR